MTTSVTHLAPMDQLRAEHRELLPNIDALAQVAGDCTTAAPVVLREDLSRVLTFLKEHLAPHAAAEDAVLYPAVERVMSAPGATATMTRDHVEVGWLIGELAAIVNEAGPSEAEIADDIRRHATRVLYALHAIVALHFAKEEEIYVPLLDERLTVAEGAALMEEMEIAAARYRSAQEH